MSLSRKVTLIKASNATRITCVIWISFSCICISIWHYIVPSKCYGVDFTLNAYSDTGTAPLALFDTTSKNAVVWNNGGNFEATSGMTGMSVASRAGSYSIRFTNPVALSSSVAPRSALSLTVGGTSWNSSSVAAVNGRHYNYVNSGYGGAPKATLYYVRPVRAF